MTEMKEKIYPELPTIREQPRTFLQVKNYKRNTSIFRRRN